MSTTMLKQVMTELESLGSAQTRKIYANHGGTGKMFGVSYANINRMAKEIKRNQPLAEQLWQTGNLDAQALATVVADPKLIRKATLDGWTTSMDCMGPEDYLVRKVVTRTPYAKSLAAKWMKSRKEYVMRAGFHTMALLAKEGNSYSDEELEEFLEVVKGRIHSAPNRGREAMNHAVIAIGSVRSMKAKAIAAAKEIGPVDIDHGKTSCKTPDAVDYIRKIHARNKK